MKDNMFYGASAAIFKRAQELRENMTSAEKIIWNHIHINEWKLKFRRQHPISNFIVDFYCHALKLVIEIDGDIHDLEDVKKYDFERETQLKELGLNILRIKNEEVFRSTNQVLLEIDQTIRKLSSPLSGDGGKLYVIKIGGNIIDDEQKLHAFLKDFASLKSAKILVHGGGKLATRLAEQLKIPQQMIEGRRITDAETLKVATMVYAGFINKNIVAQLHANGCDAIGICGADGNAILSHKRTTSKVDYGFVGDVDAINTELLRNFCEQMITPVIAPITHDGKGQLLNTNADTIAQEIATAMTRYYEIELIYSFEKKGVLMNAADDDSVISSINATSYAELKGKNIISGGMLPKLDNAFEALTNGVKKVIIGKAEELHQLFNGTSGTAIVNE